MCDHRFQNIEAQNFDVSKHSKTKVRIKIAYKESSFHHSFYQAECCPVALILTYLTKSQMIDK